MSVLFYFISGLLFVLCFPKHDDKDRYRDQRFILIGSALFAIAGGVA